MERKVQTIETYDRSANQLADKFNSQGPRISDVEETLQLADKKNPKVLEIGCGNGRDAREILKRTNDYLGIDISGKLLDIAKREIPKGNFEVADIEGYPFPKNLDIVFAFASLIHVPKESLKKIAENSYEALNPGGLMRVSLKYSDHYRMITKEDEFGIRTYYLYSPDDLKEIFYRFSILKNITVEVRGQRWLELLCKKDATSA